MFYPENNLPCALCKEIGFHAVDDNRSAGFLECAAARIAVQFELEPQPHLTFYPPLRLPADVDAGCSFLSACLDEGDERWFDFEFSPISGQVSWRRDLPDAAPDTIDKAVRDARGYFDECWPWLEETVARCGTPRKRRSVWKRFIQTLAEV